MKNNICTAIFIMVITLYGCAKLPSKLVNKQADTVDIQAQNIVNNMSLREKLGQKLMLDFRYYCNTMPRSGSCKNDVLSVNSEMQQILTQNQIGGVILFANNLKTIPQIVTLTDTLQQTMRVANEPPLLIATDQEGGIVARLPRESSVTFPGNMAIAAASLGNKGKSYSGEVGKTTAINLKAVGINTNFAPDVDVNSNPLNPVINVRSFSDDPKLVAELGLEFSRAMQEQGIASTLKHFPGHGDTAADSHIGLPVVSHNLELAWQIDLYPFESIIKNSSPDMIMTAHIQYPALDDSVIYASKSGKNIITPATLSYKIQHNILRNKLGYKGVTITDALDMGAISQNFNSTDATIKAFQAGVDIALMPVTILQPSDVNKVNNLMTQLESAVKNNVISEDELNKSVLRLIKLKLKLKLYNPDTRTLPQKITDAEQTLANKNQRILENNVANAAVTLVQNNHNVVPIKLLSGARIHIVMPSTEQQLGIIEQIKFLQQEKLLPKDLKISSATIGDTNLAKEKTAVNKADIVIVGNSTKSSDMAIASDSTGNLISFNSLSSGSNKISSSLSNAQFAYKILQYAKSRQKKTIFISLLAPYDLPNYKNVADVMLASYNSLGYINTSESNGYYRGPMMPALTRVIFGFSNATGKLPVDIPNSAYPAEILYHRGYGLITSVNIFYAVDKQIESDVAAGFPGAVLLIIKDGKIVKNSAYGYKYRYNQSGDQLINPESMELQTIFDLASNTKMYATNYAIMHLVYEGKLDINKPVSYYIPEYRGCDANRIPQCRNTRLVKDLLMHDAGYMPSPQFYNPVKISEYGSGLYSQNRESTIDIILTRIPFVNARGEKPVYSDVDFMLLGILVEKITHQRLDQYVYNTIYKPLGLKNTMFNPEQHGVAGNDCAATELDGNTRDHQIVFPNVRNYTLKCQVHDENSYYSMNGVAGHAGLFSTASDLAVLVEFMLNNGKYNNVTLWDEKVEDQFTRVNLRDDTYALGWRIAGSKKRYAPFGEYAPSTTVGHAGFTGTLTLIDREHNLAIILLTNKVHTKFVNKQFQGNEYATGKYFTIVNLIYQALL